MVRSVLDMGKEKQREEMKKWLSGISKNQYDLIFFRGGGGEPGVRASNYVPANRLTY